jgi:hypothetical protein
MTDILHFDFTYSKYFKERKWDEKYGLDIKIDFSKLEEWEKFTDIIPLHQLYLLCELSYNISEIFRVSKRIKA